MRVSEKRKKRHVDFSGKFIANNNLICDPMSERVREERGPKVTLLTFDNLGIWTSPESKLAFVALADN